MKLPARGISRRKILAALESFKTKDIPWGTGRVFGYVYDPGEKVRSLAKEAYTRYLTENGLDFTSFPSLLRLENDLIAFATEHLRGGGQATGNFTSGGTESIMLAVKAARDRFQAEKGGKRRPEMLLPVTAHAAFHKAAHYLGVDVVPVAVRADFRADPGRLRRALTPRSMLIVCSAPSYAHGVVDPVAEIAALASEKNILCHVDACVGGFLLPFYRRLGLPAADFDFAMPGVTSISMDLHKFAYTPKGASLVMYRDKQLRRHQIFTCARWTGYSVVNTAVQSSKSGGPLAAAWATLNFIGEQGYLDIARLTWESTERLRDGIRRMDGFALTTEPDFCMFSFRTLRTSPFYVAELMNRRGWYVQPQLRFANSPANIHLSITLPTVAWAEAFLADLKACESEAAKRPQLAAGRGFAKDFKRLRRAGRVSAAEVLGLVFRQIEVFGEAAINDILDSMDADMREQFITDYVNDAFGAAEGAALKT